MDAENTVAALLAGFPIVIATLDHELRVLKVRPMPPGRLLLPRPCVHHVLECAVGADLRPGDVLLPI